MIYISGRITGNKNWEKQFHKAEIFLIKKYYDDVLGHLTAENVFNRIYKHYKENIK